MFSQAVQWSRSQIRNHAFQFNFYRAHLCYFIATILITSAVFWASNTDGFQVAYIDALTMCASAMTNTGLSTINLSSVNAYQQSVFFVLMALGDLSIVSVSVVYVRRHFFGKKIRSTLKHSKAARRLAEDIEEQRRNRHDNEQETSASTSASDMRPHEDNDPVLHSPPVHRRSRGQLGYGGVPAPWQSRTLRSLVRIPRQKRSVDHHYLSFSPELDEKVRRLMLNVKR